MSWHAPLGLSVHALHAATLAQRAQQAAAEAAGAGAPRSNSDGTVALRRAAAAQRHRYWLPLSYTAHLIRPPSTTTSRMTGGGRRYRRSMRLEATTDTELAAMQPPATQGGSAKRSAG